MKSFLSVVLLGASLFSSSALAASDSAWKFGVGAGYSPNFLLSLKSTSSTTGTTADFDAEYSGAAGFSVHAWYVPRNAWAFISGYEYGGERDITKQKVNGVSQTITSVSKYQMNNLYVGTAYRWDSFYLPLALNYGFVNFTKAPASTAEYETKDGIGMMLGVGWFIGDSFVIEYVGRSSTTELNSKQGSTTISSTGTVASAMLTLKYMY
jgi:hypothetical protein